MRALLLLLLLAGCQRVTDDMARQPRTNPAQTSQLFADGNADRPPPPGTLPASATQQFVGSTARGRERYAIYCLPCHGATGAGDGEVVRRGFPAPPPLAGLRDASDQRLFDAIRHGAGRMVSFADRVSENDAWAIVRYLRRLQQ